MVDDEPAVKVAAYLQQAAEYRSNTDRLLAAADYAKAGEALWGAAVSLLKAWSIMTRGAPLPAGQARRFGKEMAATRGWNAEWRALAALHANFYDQFLDGDEVIRDARRAVGFYEGMVSLVRHELGARAPAERPSAP